MRSRPLHRRSIWLAGLVLLAGCDLSHDDVRAVHLDQPFEVGNGRSVVVEETGMDVTFTEVVSDGRCPVEWFCESLVAGSVTIHVAVALPGHARQVLTLSSDSNQDLHASYAGYDVALVTLDPPRHADGPIPSWQYRATLEVTRMP